MTICVADLSSGDLGHGHRLLLSQIRFNVSAHRHAISEKDLQMEPEFKRWGCPSQNGNSRARGTTDALNIGSEALEKVKQPLPPRGALKNSMNKCVSLRRQCLAAEVSICNGDSF